MGSCDKLGSQGVGSVDNLRLSKSAEVEDTYWELGDLRPSHLISFAYQIACGMVSADCRTGFSQTGMVVYTGPSFADRTTWPACM